MVLPEKTDESGVLGTAPPRTVKGWVWKNRIASPVCAALAPQEVLFNYLE